MVIIKFVTKMYFLAEGDKIAFHWSIVCLAWQFAFKMITNIKICKYKNAGTHFSHNFHGCKTIFAKLDMTSNNDCRIVHLNSHKIRKKCTCEDEEKHAL